MKIFCPQHDLKFANIVTKYDSDAMKFGFSGQRLNDTWTAIEMKIPHKSKKIADFMYSTSGELVVSQSALEKLMPLIGPHVETLPLICDWGEYWIINALEILDCIDYEHSEYTIRGSLLRPNGYPRFIQFSKRVFSEEIIKEIPLFKETGYPLRPLYVNDDFVNLVESLNLKGLKFQLIWNSEEQ